MSFYIQNQSDWTEVTAEANDITVEVHAAPVSVQAKSKSRSTIIDRVRELTRHCDFVFTNDVSVEIQWRVEERTRYESDESADVDNIIKPLMDAISGPEGILINDCQVQSITSYWVGQIGDQQSLSIRVRSVLEDWKTRKQNLLFVQYSKALCMPFDSSLGREILAMMGGLVSEQLRIRDEALGAGICWSQARYVLPCQRFFHRTRVGDFPVMSYEAFEQKYGPMPSELRDRFR